MNGLRSQFGASLALAAFVAVATLASMAAMWWATRHADREVARRRVGLVGLAGAVGVVLAATALPTAWPPVRDGWGDLALQPGRGGLASWRELARPLESLATVQLWANVVVYLPVGAALAAVTRSALRTFALGLVLSVLVESWQLVALSRVASTDDVLLNLLGTGLGAVLTISLRRATHSRGE